MSSALDYWQLNELQRLGAKLARAIDLPMAKMIADEIAATKAHALRLNPGEFRVIDGGNAAATSKRTA